MKLVVDSSGIPTAAAVGKHYYVLHREAINERQRQYDILNREAIKLRQRLYYLERKEKSKRYRTENREEIQRRQRDWYARNKEEIRGRKREYRARRSKLPFEIEEGEGVTKEEGKSQEYNQKREGKNETHWHRQYYQENKDDMKEAMRRYYLKNKEVAHQRQRRYYLENKEVVHQRHRRYYTEKRETIKDRKRQYYLANQFVIKERLRMDRLASPRKYKQWKSIQDVWAFFESIRVPLGVKELPDWYRVSNSQVVKLGGSGLYNTFKRLGQAVVVAYPSMKWDLWRFSVRRKKAEQRWLRVVLERLLPENTEIMEDVLHPLLLWENTQMKMELDIWVPKFKLALEYQGEQHYRDLPSAFGPSGTLGLYMERDLKKKTSCFKQGITLASIPYWWDGSQDSLASTLHYLRPDIFPQVNSPPIPTHPPTPFSKDTETKQTAILMHGREWTESQAHQQDPTGWLITEKLDGIRAYWDGFKFISKNGKSLSVPLQFSRSLPKNVPLDGELWAGYDSFNNLLSIIKKSNLHHNPDEIAPLWQDIKFCVFDAPMYPGNYVERHMFARDSITGSEPNKICMIPFEPCLGLEHLQLTLRNVLEKKGEGIMIYKPDAAYTPGRTNNLLKVKAV